MRILKNKILIAVLVFLVIIIFIISYKNEILKIIYPKTYNEIVTTYAEKYEVDSNLIFAVIKAESNFKEDAVSSKSAIGLMQIVENTAIDVARKNNIEIKSENIKEELLNVDNNINIGTKYLETLLKKYNNLEVALAAY